MTEERRRSPRVGIPRRVSGRSLASEGEVVVIDMSLGGMSVESDFSMAIGTRREFRLRLGDGATVHLVGRVRHSRRISDDAEEPRYVSGIELVDEDPGEGQLPVTDLIKRLR